MAKLRPKFDQLNSGLLVPSGGFQRSKPTANRFNTPMFKAASVPLIKNGQWQMDTCCCNNCVESYATTCAECSTPAPLWIKVRLTFSALSPDSSCCEAIFDKFANREIWAPFTAHGVWCGWNYNWGGTTNDGDVAFQLWMYAPSSEWQFYTALYNVTNGITINAGSYIHVSYGSAIDCERSLVGQSFSAPVAFWQQQGGGVYNNESDCESICDGYLCSTYNASFGPVWECILPCGRSDTSSLGGCGATLTMTIVDASYYEDENCLPQTGTEEGVL